MSVRVFYEIVFICFIWRYIACSNWSVHIAMYFFMCSENNKMIMFKELSGLEFYNDPFLFQVSCLLNLDCVASVINLTEARNRISLLWKVTQSNVRTGFHKSDHLCACTRRLWSKKHDLVGNAVNGFAIAKRKIQDIRVHQIHSILFL